MIKSISLKYKFIVTYISIILASLIATIVTYIIVYYALDYSLGLKATLKFHHLPRVDTILKTKGVSVLNEENHDELEAFFSKDNIHYQVVDKNASIKYGTIKEPVIKNYTPISDLAGVVQILENMVTEYKPIFDKDGNIIGMLILKYSDKPIADNSKFQGLVSTIYNIIYYIPFVFILLFTFLFSLSLSRKFKAPIQELIVASEKIQMRDLDFEIKNDSCDEIGQLSKSFEEMRKQLKISLLRECQLEQERRDMVTALVHDICTPLTIIQGHVDTLLEGGKIKEDRVERYLGIIQQNAQRVSGLVKEMNLVSEVEHMGFELHLVEINLSNFISEKSDTYSVLCKQKNINFFTKVSGLDHDNKIIFFDGNRVSQVLDNIIGNSIRFTPCGGEIIMSLVVYEEGLSFSISDTGTGFEQKDLLRVFNKYYRGDINRSSNKGNIGFGLYICKCIVEKHGGVIMVENRKEGGACVKFKIKTRSILA